MTAESTQPKTIHACPVCGDSEHIGPLCHVDGADVYTCATCTADHVYPMPSARALKAYYDRREWFEGGEKGGYENYDAQVASSVGWLESILPPFGGQAGLSLLDLGCGYGAHLATAAKLGWTCFGVEPSDHARAIAQERLGGAAYIVESVTDLIPHEFDVVLMLDVIEHLPSPYPTFYQLFSIGAITAKTLVVITTPNAGATAARRNPASWPYRHPSSHLVHYSAQAVRHALERLHFAVPDIRGLAPGTLSSGDLSTADGLLVTAHGSDFAEFMRERYVPGTWSKIAEYEHMPRYALAKTLATNKVVLDFGCGTGYGAAMMAQSATRVTGLDIDAAALAWAQQSHRNPRLVFERHGDLGATLGEASVDLITCFEVIEHVDMATQQAAVASMARLLRHDGLLLISTPNPDVTALYGANPYHLREMSEPEFRALLAPHFSHIRIFRQYVRVAVAVDQDGTDERLTPGAVMPGTDSETKPLAFIALCSRRPLPDVPNRVLFDQDIDYIEQFMVKERALNKVRLDAYRQGELAQSLKGQFSRTLSQLNETTSQLTVTTQRLVGRETELMARETQLVELERLRVQEKAAADAALQAKAGELETLHRIRNDELSSPRFLGRQFLRATRSRLHAILQDRLSRLRGV